MRRSPNAPRCDLSLFDNSPLVKKASETHDGFLMTIPPLSYSTLYSTLIPQIRAGESVAAWRGGRGAAMHLERIEPGV